MRFVHLLLLGVGGCLMVSPSNLAQNCLLAEAGDSRDFGYAIAANNNRIAVGDPEANRVVLYDYDLAGTLSRANEIYPPPDSAAEAVGAGFGYDLSLDDERLIVGAYFETRRPSNPDAFQWTNQLGTAYSGGVYQVMLGSELSTERIDTEREAEISGFSVAAAGGTVAFSTRTLQASGVGAGRVELMGELTGELGSQQVLPPTPEAAQSFGIDIALSERHLLVGAPFDWGGSAWLFELANLEDANSEGENLGQHSRRLAAEGVFAGSKVALTDQFAAVGSLSSGSATSSAKTLLFSLASDQMTALDGIGELSLNNSLLARSRSHVYEGSESIGLMLFDLTQLDVSQEAPRPVETRSSVRHAYLGSQALVTLGERNGDRQLCVEPLGG